MNNQQLKELINTGIYSQIKTAFEVNRDVTRIAHAIKQYDPKNHNVHDRAIDKRPDKYLYDDNGQLNGYVPVWRLSVPLQKKIVLIAAAFLGTPEIESSPEGPIEDEFKKIFDKTWEDNKLDYKFRKISKTTMSETECAELWYMTEAEDDFWDEYNLQGNVKLKVRLLHNSWDSVTRTGYDTLYPVYDAMGDMIAFGRGFSVSNPGNDDVEHLDIYTKEIIYYGIVTNDRVDFSDVTNPFGKIPVIYYSQHITEWDDVQEMIDRLETKLSNHADTNDYYDSPILFAEGKVSGFADKGERGKVIEGEIGAKVSYLTWNNLPESTRMELDNLLKFIHSSTHTPDISFEQMKGLGIFSGIALKMLFLDAHLKSSDKEDLFGEAVQRRINLLKAGIIKIDARYKPAQGLKMKPKFTFFMPQNLVEELEAIEKAINIGIISKETSVMMNPLLTNPEEELQRIKDEKEAELIIPIAPINIPTNGKPVNN